MFRSEAKPQWPWIVAFAAAFALISLIVHNDYYQLIMTNVLVWTVMGLAWNLLSGYSGLISFGHAAFFGLGAYFTVLAQTAFGLTPWVGIPLAGVLGTVAGLVVGVPTFRLRGHYFALAMLAYPLALLYVFEWLGFQEVAVPRELEATAAMMQFHDRPRVYVAIGILTAVAAMGLTRRLEKSRYGMSLLAIKQDETAAEAVGIDSTAWKLRAIALSGGIAAAIGGFYAIVQLVVTPSSVFGVLISAQALIVAMFGGVGSLWGPVIGAATLVPLSAWLDASLAESLPGIQGVVYGVAIVGVIMIAPEGVFWRIRDAAIRLRAPQPDRADATAEPAVEPADGAGDETVPSEFHVASDQPGPLLEVAGLGKSFGGLRAVDGVSLAVASGEIVGIIGPNGAGKTTLFNLLNGFIRPDRGSIRFAGAEISAERPSRICALGIGRTFQVVKPFERMSIADNVVVGSYLRAGSDASARELALAALRAVGLEHAAATIAGGATNEELRLMELARALATKPSLLLLDEVFAGLTSEEVRNLMRVIRRLAAAGITIVVIEHTMQAMVKLVDRFVVLDHGAVLTDGAPDEVTRNPAVIEAYLGRRWAEHA